MARSEPRSAQWVFALTLSLFTFFASSHSSLAQTIETITGTTDITGRDPISISIRPWGLAKAPDGTLTVANAEFAQVLRFDPATQSLAVIAGTGVSEFAGDGGLAINAKLNNPVGVAYDSSGNLYIADIGSGRIRRVAAGTGIITTVAGGGWNGTDGIPATDTYLEGPWAIAIGPDDSLYIAEQYTARVRRVSLISGLITTVAGTGPMGSSGDGGLAIHAQLGQPSGLALDAVGNLFIADQFNHSVRKVDASTGIITRYAGTGVGTWEVVNGQPATETPITMPVGLQFDAAGNLLIVEQGTSSIRVVDGQTGLVSRYMMDIAAPQGLAILNNGDTYVSSPAAYTLQRVYSTGSGIIVAGNGKFSDSGDGAPAALAQVLPNALVIDYQGNVSLAHTNRIRTIDKTSGLISTTAGAGEWGIPADGGPALNAFFAYITALARDAEGNVFVAEQGNLRIRKISAATGTVNHYAGTGYGYGGDGGPAVNATMRMIADMAVDANGNLFTVEEGGTRVRRIDRTTGIITTIAGNGQHSGPLNDGSPATSVALYYPNAIAVDSSGHVYISELNRIRRIDSVTGIITTVAGNGTYGETGDGGPALSAGLQITDFVIDSAQNIYTTNVFTNRIRKIDATTGIITTFAGDGTNSSTGDGGPALLATLNNPRALALSPTGDLLISEAFRVRRIIGIMQQPDGTPPVITPTISGPLGNNGWYVGNVSVSWSVTDPESAISSQMNCSTTTVNSDTAGVTLTCTATSAGGSANVSVAIQRDTVGPSATAGAPAEGASYQNGSSVSANYSCNDAMSGVATCSGTLPNGNQIDTSTNGPKSFVINMTDLAGNASTRTISYTVNPPDTTPPIIAPSVSGTQGGATGWYLTNAVVTWFVSDPQSSIVSSSGCTSTTVSTDTAGLILTCTATSAGGTSSNSVTIKRDTVPPTAVYGPPTSPPNAAGWYKSDVIIPYTKSDSLSGIPGSATGTITVTGQGNSVSMSHGFSDIAGNWASYLTPAVKIDRTTPTSTITVPASGATYAVGSSVLAAYTCSDALSGVSTCTGPVANGVAIDTATAGTKTFTVNVTDVAGNVSSASVTYTVGSAPPGSYCSSRGNNSSYEWIRSVQVIGFTNLSNNNGGYGSFLANPISLMRGTNSIVLTPGFGQWSYSENWRVWVDLNRDGTFAASEQLFSGTSTSSSALSGSINIPISAASGQTRMRVSMVYGATPAPCGNFTYGEVEDYTVAIP